MNTIQQKEFIARFMELSLDERNAFLEQCKIKITEGSYIAEPKPEIVESDIVKFLKSVNNHYRIITGLPQTGKTQAIIDFILECIKQKIPVLVSSDDKTDQQDQLYDRIKYSMAGDPDVILLKLGDTNFHKRFIKAIVDKKQIIMFCLDNASQIGNLCNSIILSDTFDNTKNIMRYIKTFVIIHDEGDVVQKDKNVHDVNIYQPKSHQKWIQLVKTLENYNRMLKRVFVTATPECIMACFNIHPSQIHHLRIKDEYTGFNKIVCKNIDINIRKILENEYNRIINNIDNNPVGEIILYCIERNIEKGANSQIEILRSLSVDRQDNILTNATIHTYTGTGIIVHTKNQKLKQLLSEIAVDITTKSGKTYKKIVKPIKNKYPPFITLDKAVTIRHFYSLCKNAGSNVVITIGKDLITRGISYVSDTHLDYIYDTKNGTDRRPLCATTMILKTSYNMHAVGINQIVGRICGNARPDLKRTLYSTKNVISKYIKYNDNQKDFFDYLKSTNTEDFTAIIWKVYEFIHTINKLDRPGLEISQNGKETNDTGNGISKLKVIDLWNSDTIPGKILRILYTENEKILIPDLKIRINYTKSMKSFISSVANGQGEKTQYAHFWDARENKIIMNPQVRSILSSYLTK